MASKGAARTTGQLRIVRRVALAVVVTVVVLAGGSGVAAAALPVAGSGLADPAPAPLFDYASFSDASDPALAVNGQARVVPPVLRLTDTTAAFSSGSAWYRDKVDVGLGWETRFTWRLSGASPEGLAFVVQNDSSGALGATGGGRGFAGIPDSLAVEIATTAHATAGEPPAPFISVQTAGVAQNSTDFNNSLASATASSLGDGGEHLITVRYLPSAGAAAAGGLSIYVDDATDPIIALPTLDLPGTLALADGLAWIGFTASNGTSPNTETADIESWSFGPAAPATQLAITSAPVSGSATPDATLGPITVAVRDANRNPVFTTSPTTVALRSSSPAGIFASASGGAPVSSVTIPAGRSSTVVYYGDTLAGTPTVTATAAGLASATQDETITPGPAASIVLSPASASIAAGDSQTYTVQAFDAYRNPLPKPDATLAIGPDGSCKHDADTYSCTATTAGPHRVLATLGELTSDATLDVRPAKLGSLVLSPGSAALTAGDTRTYSVEGWDIYGNDMGPDANASLSISPDGSCSGNACTATVVGDHTVTATDGAVTGTAFLTVGPGPLASIVLSPSSASIAAGGSQSYVVRGVDPYGNLRGVDLNASLSISPDGSCSGFVCTANVAGLHTVTATDGQLTSAASLTVRPAPTVTNVSPSSGPPSGGTSVTITGTNLTGATAVKFGDTAAPFTPVSSTRITATSPPHSAGTVDVTVTTADGTTQTSSADRFSYTSADLSLSITGPSTASSGSRITYTMTVKNAGPSTASSVTLSNNLPYGTQYTAVSTTQGTCTPPGKTVKRVTCTLGDIANAGSTSSAVTVKITAKPGSGYLNDVATVSSPTFDPATGNNSASLSTTVTK